MPNLAHECVDRPHLPCPACLAAEVQQDAVAWIRVVGEELVNAGFPAGDRTVILANIRKLIAERREIKNA